MKIKKGQTVYLKCRIWDNPPSKRILKFPMAVKAVREKAEEVYVVDEHGAHWVSVRNTSKDALWVTTR